jgi:hypothetical protein
MAYYPRVADDPDRSLPISRGEERLHEEAREALGEGDLRGCTRERQGPSSGVMFTFRRPISSWDKTISCATALGGIWLASNSMSTTEATQISSSEIRRTQCHENPTKPKLSPFGSLLCTCS